MQSSSSDHAPSPHDPSLAHVFVDFESTVTSEFLGAGVEWSAYPWWDLTETEWQRVFRRLEFMRVPLTRTMQSAFYYWDGDDSSGHPNYSFDSTYQRKLRKLLDWCEEHGTRVILGEWGAPTDPAGNRVANDDPRWTRMIGDFLADLFQRNKYRCVRHFNLVNEPHGDWSTIAGRFDEWRTAILNLQKELHRRGLGDRLTIAAPDADAQWLQRTLDDSRLCESTGLYDVHWYMSRDEISNNRVEQGCRDLCRQIANSDPAKPLVFAEIGIVDGKTSGDCQPNVFGFDYGVEMADAAIQLMRGGSAGFIAWYLDDAMHFLGDGEYVPRDGEPLPADAYDRRKVWGMWNSLGDRMGQPEQSQLRPWFYSWSLLSRYFPAGCTIVAVDQSPTPSLVAAAARVVEGGETGISLAIVNRSNEPQSISLQGSGLESDVDLCRFDYFDLDADGRPDAWPVSIDANGDDVFPGPSCRMQEVDFRRGMILELPGRGMTLLTTLDSSSSKVA